MKKLALTALLVLVSASSTSAFAQVTGGFNGPAGQGSTPQSYNTVQSVLASGPYADEMQVTLTGTILKSLGNERYIFADSTGEITVEIDHDDWYGLVSTPTTVVVINGEIDKERGYAMIEVDRILQK